MRTVTRLPQPGEQLELDLPIDTLVHPDHPATATLQERFEAFHDANRWVYHALVLLTEDWLAKGQGRIGIGMLFEVLRWQYGRVTVGDRFRLDNNHRSRYARKLIAEHPEWEHAFETRELRTP